MRAIVVGALLLGCESRALSDVPTNNPNYDVALLFEHDGCRVYRFYDAGTWRYFVRCPETTSALQAHKVSCGKGCETDEHDEIRTTVER